VLGNQQEDFRHTLAFFGFFGLTVTGVIQMRVVAQLLRRESDGVTDRRV